MRIAFIKKFLNYFTAEEMGQSSDDLTDEELDAVAGGHKEGCLPMPIGKTWST